MEYFDLLERSENGIVAFQMVAPSPENSTLSYDGRYLPDWPNCNWTKGDLFDYFGVRNDRRFTHVQTFSAGIVLVKKCKNAVKIIDEWNAVIKNNFSLLDDTPSRSSNFDGFVDHRHDQAIFSLLCLKHKVTVLSAYEFWYPANLSYGILGMDWEALEDFPIHAKRDKKIGLLVRIRTKLISSVRAMLRAKRRTRSG